MRRLLEMVDLNKYRRNDKTVTLYIERCENKVTIQYWAEVATEATKSAYQYLFDGLKEANLSPTSICPQQGERNGFAVEMTSVNDAIGFIGDLKESFFLDYPGIELAFSEVQPPSAEDYYNK